MKEANSFPVDEFKFVIKVQLADSVTQAGYNGGFSGTIAQPWTALMFNLYTNPKEDETVSIRHIPAAIPIAGELQRYREVLKKYPPRTQISLKQ